MITGTISSDGVTVSLDSSQTLSTWITVGAQVSAFKDNYTVFVNCATDFLGVPYKTSVPTSRIPRIASIAADRSSFTITTDSGRIYTDGTVKAGVRFYIAQPWNEAMTRGVWQNSSQKPPTSSSVSLGVGFFGADGSTSIPASNPAIKQVLWLYDDTFWATAANQAKGKRNASPYFLHSSIARQTYSSSPDLSVDNFNFAVGTIGFGSPTGAVRNLAPNDYIWPQGGIWRSDGSLIITGGRFNNGPDGGTVYGTSRGTFLFVPNPLDDPQLWNFVELRTPIAGGGGCQFVKSGNYYYTLGAGWGVVAATGRGLTAVRYPVSDVEATPLPIFDNPEWWCGPTFGWVGGNVWDEDFPVERQAVPFVKKFGRLLGPDSQSSLFQDSDGNWLVLQGWDFVLPVGIRVKNLGKDLQNPDVNTPPSVFATFGDAGWWVNDGAGDLIYFPPSDVGVSSGNLLQFYSCKIHPSQTWSGQRSGEFVVTYSTNNGGGFGPLPDNANYWVQTIRVSGL